MKEKAKELLLQNDFANAFKIAGTCDRDDPEVLYILGRCVEESDVPPFWCPLPFWCHPPFWCSDRIVFACMYYASACRKDKTGSIKKLVEERKKKHIINLIIGILLWPIAYIGVKGWRDKENIGHRIIVPVFIGTFFLLGWLSNSFIVAIITAFLTAWLSIVVLGLYFLYHMLYTDN